MPGIARRVSPLKVRSSSISRATAKVDHISEMQKPVAIPPAENIKRKGMSWGMWLVILMLVIGPLTTVVGMNLQDHVITISAEVDGKGVIRRIIPDIKGP